MVGASPGRRDLITLCAARVLRRLEMSFYSQMEREIESIEAECERGDISSDECKKQIQEVYRDACSYLEEEAQRAYDDVMDCW